MSEEVIGLSDPDTKSETIEQAQLRQQLAQRHKVKAEALPALNRILARHGAVATQEDVQTVFDLMERYAKA